MTEPSSPKRRWVAWTLYAFVCLIAIAAGSGLGWLSRSPILSQAVADRVKSAVGIKPVDPFENVDALTLLVLGCDADYSRGGKKILRKYARSDMMMVVKLDLLSKQVTGVSIPRDTLVEAAGYREQKINAYHSIGGTDAAKSAVETLLPGVKIDRVVVLDFENFQQMVDIAGGVELDVKKRMKWTDKAAKLKIDLKPGVQKLDGYNAMGFVRFRHTDSDMHRMERQRQFLIAFKKAVFGNPLQIPEIANKAVEALNGSLTNDEILALAKFSKDMPDEAIKIGTVPTVDAGSYNLRVDSTKLTETLQEYHLIPGPTAVASATP